jgi:1,4-alpha-glucan branching enzyme
VSPGGDSGGDVPAGWVGDIAIVLHSHMPYVEGFGTYPFGEEWLFDAYLRSHLPVLAVARDLTLTVTPVLADQLEAPGVAARLEEFTREFRVRSAELDAADVEAPLAPACRAEAERYAAALATIERRGGDLLGAFAEVRERGVELVPSAATHAVLPLLASRECRHLQLDAGLRSHRRRFGPARGFWLPECAYEPGLERLLGQFGVDWFCTDQSAHEPAEAALRPVATAGATACTIDWEAVSWLWSLTGYPSDPVYADFHRKSLRGCRPWSIGGGPYEPERARERAREQAREFAAAVASRLAAHGERTGRPGLLTFAVDTELLGHWWWEGPIWLEEALAALPAAGVRPLSMERALRAHEPEPRALRRSTWGEAKDFRTWDSPPVADLAWGLRRLELAALRAVGAGRLAGDALLRGARELLAAQSSDWAFLDYTRQAGDYPYERALLHSRALYEAIESPERQAPGLRNLAPDLSPAPLLEP